MVSREGIVETVSCVFPSISLLTKNGKKKTVNVMSQVLSFVYSNIRVSSLTNSKMIILKIQSSSTPVQCDVWSFLNKSYR